MTEIINLIGGLAKFFVSSEGVYMGSLSSSPASPDIYNVPEGWVEVDSAPSNVSQSWLFPGWSDDLESGESERAWRNSELYRADVELNKSQDGDGVGTVKAWREYRKSLRAWPDTKGFPSREFRPVAPDFQSK